MAILEVKELTKKFGGNIAVNKASFSVEENIINCLIGPNGSGKTTIFNLITGVLPSDGGKVIYKGKDLLRMSTQQVVEFGIVRTFQDLKLFPEFTVLQNVLVSIRGRYGENIFQSLVYSPTSDRAMADRQRAQEAIEAVGLTEHINTVVRSMPYGMQKLVSLARLYATEADILLLDEPASGMDREGYSLLDKILKMFISRGKTVLLVEHNIEFVKSIAQRVTFLHQGSVLVEGKIEDIIADRHLTEIYFGY